MNALAGLRHFFEMPTSQEVVNNLTYRLEYPDSKFIESLAS